MLAFAWALATESQSPKPDFSTSLAASLCAGIGGNAAAFSEGPQHFAFRRLAWSRAEAQVWRPALAGQATLVAFHGYFDNLHAIADQLGLAVADADPAEAYAAAVAAWGDAADLRIIGEYCAIISDDRTGILRLSRSPLKAPALVHARNAEVIAAASVPRALFAAGIDRKVDMRRVADSAMNNDQDLHASWFEGVRRVPLGTIVEIHRDGRPDEERTYYRIGEVPPVRLSPQACVARVGELLDEAVQVCLAGSHTPGATLSGGLDSPQVAVRALRQLPSGQRLPTFTFHPEAGWDGTEMPGTLGNERPVVERLAALHPGLEPHFIDNAGRGHDWRWNDLFTLMDSGSTCIPIAYAMHGVFEAARQRGCDMLLLATWGNDTFSERGQWAFVEYLVKGRWRQLWRALKYADIDDRSPLRRFAALCLVPLLPNPVWRLVMRLRPRGGPRLMELINPLRRDYRRNSGAEQRRKANKRIFERYQPRSRRHANELGFTMIDADTSEVYQALQLLYGLPCRDPTAYRPLVEFCLGLPTDMFMRDGVPRWLARQLAQGLMPPEQAQERRNGRWDADWHLRLRRSRATYLDDLDRISDDEELAAMIDVPRLRQTLEQLPEKAPTTDADFAAMRLATINGLLAARFVQHSRGRN